MSSSRRTASSSVSCLVDSSSITPPLCIDDQAAILKGMPGQPVGNGCHELRAMLAREHVFERATHERVVVATQVAPSIRHPNDQLVAQMTGHCLEVDVAQQP